MHTLLLTWRVENVVPHKIVEFPSTCTLNFGRNPMKVKSTPSKHVPPADRGITSIHNSIIWYTFAVDDVLLLSAETGDFDVFGLFVNRLVVDDVGAALLLGAGLVGGALVAADFEPTVKSLCISQ